MLENISIVMSLCISVVSLVIAVLSFRLKKPKFKVQILNKEYDGFFGNVACERKDRIVKNRISGVRLRIINNSPTDIAIMGLLLKHGKETYRHIENTNDFWEIVEFVYPDEDGNETSDGSAIYYKKEGIALPLNLKAYKGKDFTALFYHFPASITKKAKAKILIQTAVGVKTKKVKLVEYDSSYSDADYRDYQQYLRSMKADSDEV